MPKLTAAVTWDPKRSTLLLALRQSGSKAVMRGALKAAELPPGMQAAAAAQQQQGLAVGGADGFVGRVQGGVPTCQLKVLVRELDVLEEHPIQVGVWVWVCTTSLCRRLAGRLRDGRLMHTNLC